MTGHRVAHRAEFSVRCECGKVYNTDDTHVGKRLKCTCGRVVHIVRPAAEYAETYVHHTKSDEERRHRDAAKARRHRARAEWKARLVGGPRQLLLGALRGAWGWLVGAWMLTQSRKPMQRWTARLCWGWCAFVCMTWILLITTSESFLPATLLAYGPRWVLLLPGFTLVFGALILARRALVPVVLSLLVTVGPIMGWRFSWHIKGSEWPALPEVGAIRVLTYNTQGGGVVRMQLRDLIDRVHPDLIALQECGAALGDSLQAIPNWFVVRHHGLCTASRWPITKTDSMYRADLQRISMLGFGGTGMAVRHEITTPRGKLLFANLHLETARKGLEALIGSEGFVPDGSGATSTNEQPQGADAGQRIALNAQIRDIESDRASAWVMLGDKRLPLLVAGDFNLPVESAIYRRHWGSFTDAFEAAGTGFGWSKNEGMLFRVRIDHVLGNSLASNFVGAWLGPDVGSDHLPVIADVRR